MLQAGKPEYISIVKADDSIIALNMLNIDSDTGVFINNIGLNN